MTMRDFIEQLSGWYGGKEYRRRKSPWNLILIPLSFVFWLGIWYVLFRLVWAFHILLYPQHHLGDFWQKGVSFSSFIPSFLMVFALLPGAICLGLALANCVVWLIPPARRALDKEAFDHPGANFREATRRLLILSAITIPSGLAVALISAWALISLK